MATHTYTHSLGGRTVNIYFVHHAEVIRCEYKMVYISMLDVFKFAGDDHGIKFSCVGGGRYDQ